MFYGPIQTSTISSSLTTTDDFQQGELHCFRFKTVCDPCVSRINTAEPRAKPGVFKQLLGLRLEQRRPA